MKKIKAGIIGAAGYTGGELIRLLMLHPHTDLVFANSTSQAGIAVSEIHTDLLGDTDLVFTTVLNDDIDLLFLCLSHGDSLNFLKENKINQKIKIIDLSQDFRDESNGFIYGLPELNKEKIKSAGKIANPGCFATAIQLALLPLGSMHLLSGEIHISATTGSTGAGQALHPTTHFSWRQNNVSVYKTFEHQHLKEVGHSLTQLQPEFKSPINFIPYRGSFTRGIFASVYCECDQPINEILNWYQSYYQSHPFVVISASPIDLKQAVNTNKCFLNLEKHGRKLLITSCVDNLLKGASGQALQNMNLMFGMEETTGLKLKASFF